MYPPETATPADRIRINTISSPGSSLCTQIPPHLDFSTASFGDLPRACRLLYREGSTAVDAFGPHSA
jgi:hypothetical protein